MKLNPTMLALSLAFSAFGVHAQSTDLGYDATEFKRFLLYPHLQKGFEALEKGNRARALSEFEQARSLAPNSPAVAAYLAEAYRRFGERARAESLLTEQLARNQGDVQLTKALRDLRAETQVPARPNQVQVAARPALLLSPSVSVAIKAPARKTITNTRAKVEPRTVLTPPSFTFADNAYKASAKGDFLAALPQARKAAQLAPDNRNYSKLLVYVLAQTGAYEEADQLAGKLLTGAPSSADQELAAQRQTIRRRLAFQHFDRANKALADRNSEAAVKEAQQGVAYAPDLMPHRLQLIGALLAAGRVEEANEAATQSIKDLNGEAALLVMRGYTLHRAGKRELAWLDFDQAVTRQGLTPTEQHNFRIIAAHAAMAAGEPQRALDLLAPLDATADESVRIRRQMAQEALHQNLMPHAVAVTFLPAPGVICVGSSFSPACDVWPGEEPINAAQPAAESAYKAFGRRDYAQAADKANEALALSPSNQPYRLLLVNTLVADGKLDLADQKATEFLSTSTNNQAEMLSARSAIRQRLGQRELANADATAALQSEHLSLSSELSLLLQLDRKPVARERYAAAAQKGVFKNQPDTNIAYLAVLVGDDASALAAFNRAAQEGTLPDTATQDAAYAAGRLGENNQALRYFKQSIQVADAGNSALTPQQLFNTRREVADRSRTWGANTSLTYRGISPSALAATQAGASNDSLQGGAEVWWRPMGYGDGRTLEVYGGLSETLTSKAGYPTGAESLQGALGVRVKPLADINLVLALERRIALGSKSVSDWLPRVAYSANHGTDLRVDEKSWTTSSVYAEVGRYIHQRQTYATFEGQVGRSFRLDAISPKLVVFPHAVLGADYNSGFSTNAKSAIGAGVGVNLRHWFNEDKYNAPRSYLDVSLQYRGRISGDDRAKGVFLRATLSY
jgi:Flp pilus assembly protein TadD